MALAGISHGRTILPSGGMDALLGGALVAAAGCVLLEEGGSRFPVVWPSGILVAVTSPLVIELSSDGQVRGGGGYLVTGRLGIDVPDECLNEYAEVAVFNPSADPAVNSG